MQLLTEAVHVTQTLARYVVEARSEDVPESVRREAVRSLLNWAGCAIGGTQDKYQIFLENCHVHIPRILAAVKGEAPPPVTLQTPEFARPET